MTVPIMPIASAVGRASHSCAASAPRMRLPPPTTTPIVMPRARAMTMSATMRSIVGACTPKSFGPENASPDTFTITRRWAGLAMTSFDRSFGSAGIALRSAGPGGRGNFRREVRGGLLDSLAERETRKARDLDRPADLAFGFLQRLTDALLVVEDERLLQQSLFLVEGFQPGLGDLLDHRLGLALLAELV